MTNSRFDLLLKQVPIKSSIVHSPTQRGVKKAADNDPAVNPDPSPSGPHPASTDWGHASHPWSTDVDILYNSQLVIVSQITVT